MTDKNSPSSQKKDKMPSIRTPQSAKAAESKALKRKLFDDGEKKPSKPASIKRKKTNSQPGSPTLNTSRPHPLSERQQLALLKQLTAKEAKDSSPGGQTPKHDSQNISTFKKGINKKNEKGETPLHRAAIQGDVQTAKSLIKQGADVNVQDFACWTPLHEACNHGSYDVAKQLLKAGALVNILGFQDDTPLHDAAINGHVKLVELLLKHGADPLIVNKKGKAPIDLAFSPEIRGLMRNEIIESCSDNSLIETHSPTSPESLDSAEESTAQVRDTNGETRVHVPEPVVDPYEFAPDQQPTGEQKITIHYKVPVKNGKSTRVMDVIKIPKTTQTIHAQQQERNAAGTPNSMDSLSSGDSDLFDPHLNTKPDKSPNDVYTQDKPQGPSILTAGASTPSSSSTPKHATPRLPVQEPSELARIPETRDDSESSLSESNLYISDDSNLVPENRSSVAGKADSTSELLTFSLGHPIEKQHPNLLRNVENASVLRTCTPADSSDSNVCIPKTNYSRIPLPASAPSSSLPSVSAVTNKPVTDLRTSSLPISAVQSSSSTHHHHHHQQSANSAESRNSPDSQVLLDSRRTVASESTSSSIHAAVSAKHAEESIVSQTGNRQPSVLPQEAQVHIEKTDLKSESESDSLPEWRTEAKIAEPRPESESSDSLSEKPHHSGRERSKKHKERSDKKSHRKHHRHSQGSSSTRSSKEDRHMNEETTASFTSSTTRSPSRNPIGDAGGDSRTEANDGSKTEPQNATKDLHNSHNSKDSSSQQRQSSPGRFSSTREYYIVTPPPSSTADDSNSSEIKPLLIKRNPNMVQSKSKEPPTTASAANSAQSVSSTSASTPSENTSKNTDKDSKPSTSSAAASGSDSRTALSSSNEASTSSSRKSPSNEVGNRKSPVTRESERRKSPARGSPDITSSSSGSNQAGGGNSGKSSPKNVEGAPQDESKPKVTRTLRSNSNLNTPNANADNNGNSSSTSSNEGGKSEMTVMTRSRRAAESSTSNGNSSVPEQQNVESHPRKRKIARHNKQQQPAEDPPYPMPTPLPPQDKVNTMEMFINIRNEVSQRQKTLFAPVQSKVPNGFHEYLMCRKSYLLQSSPETKVNGALPQMTPPPELPNPLLAQFQKQDKMRYMLRMRHYIEREKLMLSAEQDIMRVHGKAARAYANQTTPLSACIVFRDQEIYNMPEPRQSDDEKNNRTRFNGRQLYSLLQDVDMKYERIKEELLQRHQHEASSLYAMQRLDWELKLQELKMWDPKTQPKVLEEHVPMVKVNREFDLLPHVRV